MLTFNNALYRWTRVFNTCHRCKNKDFMAPPNMHVFWITIWCLTRGAVWQLACHMAHVIMVLPLVPPQDLTLFSSSRTCVLFLSANDVSSVSNISSAICVFIRLNDLFHAPSPIATRPFRVLTTCLSIWRLISVTRIVVDVNSNNNKKKPTWHAPPQPLQQQLHFRLLQQHLKCMAGALFLLQTQSTTHPQALDVDFIYAQHTLQSDLSYSISLLSSTTHIHAHAHTHTYILSSIFSFFTYATPVPHFWLLFLFFIISSSIAHTHTHASSTYIHNAHHVAVLTSQSWFFFHFFYPFFASPSNHCPPFSSLYILCFFFYAFLFLSFGKLTSTSFICYCLYETYYIPHLYKLQYSPYH